MMLAPVTHYTVETLSLVAGMKFSRNNGRNSKNIQRFPRIPVAEERKLPARRVPPLRIRLTCPTPEAAASAVVTLTLVPEARDEKSVWFGHECKSNTKECNVPPVYLGTLEQASGCVATFAFQPQKVWRYNHAMKKNLGRKRELHCLEVRCAMVYECAKRLSHLLCVQFSVFQNDCCVFTCFGPTFELENKKREQSSRKRRLQNQATSSTASGSNGSNTQSPKSEPSSVVTDEVGEMHYDLKRPTNKRRMEMEECMALDNTLATVFVTDDVSARFLDDPDLLFLRKANARRTCSVDVFVWCCAQRLRIPFPDHAEAKSDGERKLARGESGGSDDTMLSGSELVHAFDDDEDDDYDSAPAPIKPLSKARSDGRRVSSRRPGAGSVGSGRGSDTDGVTSDAGHTSDARSDVASVAGSVASVSRRSRRGSVDRSARTSSRGRIPKRRGSVDSTSRRDRAARARRGASTIASLDDVDVDRMLEVVAPPGGGFAPDATGELPPVCAATGGPVLHIGSDGAAQYSVGPPTSTLSAGAGGAPSLRRETRRSRRSSRLAGRQGDNAKRQRAGALASNSAGDRRTIRMMRSVSGEQVPVEIILPESDGDEAPGCTTRSIVFASIAVVMLSAVVISAALLVFTHGKQDGNHGTASSARGVPPPHSCWRLCVAGGVSLDTADCVASAWSQWSMCCDSTKTRSRHIVSNARGNGAQCPNLSESASCSGDDAGCATPSSLLSREEAPWRAPPPPPPPPPPPHPHPHPPRSQRGSHRPRYLRSMSRVH